MSNTAAKPANENIRMLLHGRIRFTHIFEASLPKNPKPTDKKKFRASLIFEPGKRKEDKESQDKLTKAVDGLLAKCFPDDTRESLTSCCLRRSDKMKMEDGTLFDGFVKGGTYLAASCAEKDRPTILDYATKRPLVATDNRPVDGDQVWLVVDVFAFGHDAKSKGKGQHILADLKSVVFHQEDEHWGGGSRPVTEDEVFAMLPDAGEEGM